MNPLDYPISQLRFVKMTTVDRGPKGYGYHDSVHMMHESQVPIFIEASIRLHHTHGNPHGKNGEVIKLNNLWEIRVTSVNTDTTSYWWCVPDLQGNGNPKGAQLNLDTFYRQVWAHPELLERAKKARAEEEHDEWQMDMELGPYAPIEP